MNEVKKIHLGRQPFTIAVDAHRLLRAYLEAIEHQVGVKSEVIKEVESRMAELLIERGITGDKVVLEDDVAFLKEQLGDPGDFKDEDHESETAEPVSQKRLFRDTQHGMVAGVCAGIAAYLGIDTTIVRLVFVLALFFGGAAIPVYLVLWLIVPEAKTSSDRLQMQGKAVTVDSIKELVDRADVQGAAQRAGSTFGKFFESLGHILLYFVGAMFAVTALSMIITIAAVGSYMLIRGGQIAGEVVFPIGAEAVVGLLCAIAVGMIISLGLFLVGLTMIKRRWMVPGWVMAAGIAIFIVASAAGTVIGFDIAPGIRDKYNSMHHVQTLSTAPFKNIEVNGQYEDFTFQPDSRYFVEVRYFGKTTKDLSFAREVKNDTLTIDASKYNNDNVCRFLCLYYDNTISVVVHAPSVDMVHVTGDNTFFTTHSLNQSKLSLIVEPGSSALIQGALADSIKVNYTAGGVQTADFEGLKPASRWTETLSLDEHMISSEGAIKNFALTSDSKCDESQPFVSLARMPAALTIGGKVINDQAQLLNLHTIDTQSVYNCVQIQ